MKKSLRFLAIIIFIVTAMASCHKTSSFEDNPDNQYPTIFSSRQEASDAVSLYFQQRGQGEQLLQISNVLFMESHNKTYALVYYQSNFGDSNILYEREYQNNVATAGKTYECSGSACNCLVQTTISATGDVSFDCSCSSCTMIINSF